MSIGFQIDNILRWYKDIIADEKIKEFVLKTREKIKDNPINSEEWYNRGENQFEQKQYEMAKKSFNKSIELETTNMKAWRGLVKTLFKQKNFQECLNMIDTAIILTEEEINNIKNTQAYAKNELLQEIGFDLIDYASQCYFNLGQYENAIESLKKIVEELQRIVEIADKKNTVDDKNVDKYVYCLNNLAYVLANTGKIEKAKEHIETALSHRQTDTASMDTKGLILYKLKRYDDAFDILTEVIGKDDHPYAYYHKGLVQIERKEYRDAERLLVEAIKRKNDFAEAYNAKAVALSKIGDEIHAKEALELAIKFNPSLVVAHENLTKIITRHNRNENFWEFWTATNTKKVVFGILGALAIALTINAVFIGSQTTVETYTFNNNSMNATYTITNDEKIPETQLAMIGLIVIVILFPEIKRAKLGIIELEKTDPPVAMGE